MSDFEEEAQAEAAEKMVELEKTVEREKQKNAEFEQALEREKQKNAEFEQALERVKQKNAEFEQALEREKQKNAEFEQALEREKMKNAELEQYVGIVRQKNDELEKIVRWLKSERTEREWQKARTIQFDTELKTAVTELEKTVEREKQKNAEFEQALEREKMKNAELEIVRQKNDELENIVRWLKSERTEREWQKARTIQFDTELKTAVTVVSSERDALRCENLKLKANIGLAKTELQQERDDVAKQWRAYRAKCNARLQKVKHYLEARKKFEPTQWLYVQAKGTRRCLEFIRDKDKVVIPAARLEKIKSDEEIYFTKLMANPVPDLLSGDFEAL